MIILGINGGYEHDASACIVVNGELKAYAEEERFVKIKHSVGYLPIYSVWYCLNELQISMNDVDMICASWLPDKYHPDIVKNILGNPIFDCKKKIPIKYFGHHDSHIAAAYYNSGFDEAVVISVDGSGENVSTSIAYAKGDSFDVIKSFESSQSLGFFYSAVGIYLGFNMWDEGKLMGLASYGVPKYEFPIRLNSDGYEIEIASVTPQNITSVMLTKWMYILNKMYGKPRKPNYIYDKHSSHLMKQNDFTSYEKDIAASAQYTLEKVLIHLISVYTKKLNCRNVVLTGGVALNCSANGRIQQLGITDDLFIMPSPNDTGTCIGAAMLACKEYGNIKRKRLTTPYWGSSFSNHEIYNLLTDLNIKYKYVSDIAKYAAELLYNDAVIGWFQGKSEIGPRALGNRSIVANPTKKSTLDRVNNSIKYREIWRPLAPSVLDDKRDWLLEGGVYSPYMLKAFKVNDSAVERVPAIVHVDQTTRPQTVRREDNDLWYDMIKEFYGYTGIPAVLNTSLNVQGQPICETPRDALTTFIKSGLDHLIIGNYVVSK